MGDVSHDLAALIAKLEAAEAGSRELDWQTAELFSIPEPWRVAVGVWPPFMPGSKYDTEIPPFTTSLDAALALAGRVLPGWIWDVTSTGTCWMMPPNEQDPTGEIHISAAGKTPALALCIAILRAKEPSK